MKPEVQFSPVVAVLRHRTHICITWVLLLVTALNASADTIHLKNGRTIEGIIEGETQPYITVSVGVGIIKLRKSQIASIERSDANDKERIQDEWQSQYFLHANYVPEGLDSLASTFRGLEVQRRNATRGIGKLKKHEGERAALHQRLEQLHENSVSVARTLQITSPKQEPLKYNELVARNNNLTSQTVTARDRMKKADEEARDTRATISNYLRSLPAFRQKFVRAKKDYEKKPEKEPNAIVFFSEIESRLDSYAKEIKVIDIPYEDRDGHFIVVASLNEKTEARFLVDTGATLVSMSRAVADQLEIPRSEANEINVTLANGSKAKAQPVMLKSVRVGDAQVKQVQALVLDDNVSDGVDGLLGMSFLREFIIRMDASNEKLIFQKLVSE